MPDQTISQPLKYIGDWPDLPGVVVADGVAVKVTVDKGHLVVNDGISGERRERRISRIDRDVKRLLILSANGYITLDAVQWLTEHEMSWSQVSRSGEVNATSGVKALTDARLIRSQAYAPATDAGLEICQYLLGQKLRGHAGNLLNLLNAPDEARYVENRAGVIEVAGNIALALTYEGLAASRYWNAWRQLPVAVPFSSADNRQVPPHWHRFTDRASDYSELARNRRATTPVNACLNFLYSGIALTECVHACHAYGLIPELGVFHADKPARNGMALDLLESVRPECERIVLELLGTGEKIPRQWFHENTDGHVRLVPPLTHKLAGYAPQIGAALLPHVYRVASILARYGDGAIPVAKPKDGRPGIMSAIGRPTGNLRRGVTVTDVIPDECWNQIRLILPDRRAHARVSACPERDLIAALAVKYLLAVPWTQTPVQRPYYRVAGRYYLKLAQAGAWDQVRSILEKSGHLGTLLSS